MPDLAELAQILVDRHDMSGTQFLDSGVPGVQLIHQETHVPRAPVVYCSGIFIILRGRKLGHLGDRVFEYNSATYIAVGLPLAMECETVASRADPLIALHLSVDPVMLRSVAAAMQMTPTEQGADHLAVRTAPLTGTMQDLIDRLVQALVRPDDAAVLGDALVRELLYRVLQGPAGPALHGLLHTDSQTTRIAEVMATLNDRLAEKFNIDDLATLAGMSPSAFHRAFRQVADDTPLQYLKKVRLSRASELMAVENYRVGMAASAVGYESAAQFSRDFRNHFGLPPADARKLGYAFIRAQ